LRNTEKGESHVQSSEEHQGDGDTCLRYRDAQAAIEWLCRAFGFEKHLVVPGEGGTIAHAELSFGNGMIMLGSVKNLNSMD
jgi:uncharacterized glyoxalase superfamily protein PhnB